MSPKSIQQKSPCCRSEPGETIRVQLSGAQSSTLAVPPTIFKQTFSQEMEEKYSCRDIAFKLMFEVAKMVWVVSVQHEWVSLKRGAILTSCCTCFDNSELLGG